MHNLFFTYSHLTNRTTGYTNKQIAPLLLIPFVENSFKHGSSKMLKHPWIKLQIFIKGNALYMNLSNSKPLQFASQNGNGIGLKNVQKRLQLLYPGQHELIIKSTDEEFSIQIQLPLHRINVKNIPAVNTKQIISEFESPSYV